MLTDLLGFLGSLISFILWIPQARKVWLVRKDVYALRGISMATQFLVMANATVWFVYAAVVQQFWVGAAGLVNFPLAVFTVAVLARARKKAIAVDYCLGCGFPGKGEHAFFVTAPAGWGSVFDCPGVGGGDLPQGVGVVRAHVPRLRELLHEQRLAQEKP